MSRSYHHIKEYETEILKLKEQGLSHREIGIRLNLTKTQVKQFFTRYHKNQRKLAAGIAIHKKGRPLKDCNITEVDKMSQLKYVLARKDAKIKQLEMENELMRDFLSLTGKE